MIYVKILLSTNLFTIILLATIAIGIAGISCYHLLEYHDPEYQGDWIYLLPRENSTEEELCQK